MQITRSVLGWWQRLSPQIAGLVILCAWAVLAAGIVFWLGPFPLEGTFTHWARFDANVLSGAVMLKTHQVHAVLRFTLVLCVSLAALGALGYQFRRRLFTPGHVSSMFYWAFTLGCCWTLFVCLSKQGYEGSWYPLHQVMYHPGTMPVFGKRLLMVWFARGVQKLFPSLTDLRAFYVADATAIFLATYVTGLWVANVIGKQWRPVGQLLLVVILSPTFSYFTFYDVAIVFFFTLALLFLYQRRYLPFVLTVGVGTLNHENILLLILVSAFILWGRESRVRTFGVPLAALGLYFAVRAALLASFPSGRLLDLRIYSNLFHIVHLYRPDLTAAVALLPWWICGLAGFFVANVFLRRACLLLPFLVGVTYLFGQFNESRQYDAFIPVLIALVLSFVAAAAKGASSMKSADAAEIVATQPVRAAAIGTATRVA